MILPEMILLGSRFLLNLRLLLVEHVLKYDLALGFATFCEAILHAAQAQRIGEFVFDKRGNHPCHDDYRYEDHPGSQVERHACRPPPIADSEIVALLQPFNGQYHRNYVGFSSASVETNRLRLNRRRWKM